MGGDNANEEATLRCTCKEGQDYRSRAEDLKKASENVDNLFEKFPESTRDFLKKVTVVVKDQVIDKASIKLTEEVTATIKIKNGNIAIERKKLEVTELETH